MRAMTTTTIIDRLSDFETTKMPVSSDLSTSSSEKRKTRPSLAPIAGRHPTIMIILTIMDMMRIVYMKVGEK